MYKSHGITYERSLLLKEEAEINCHIPDDNPEIIHSVLNIQSLWTSAISYAESQSLWNSANV